MTSPDPARAAMQLYDDWYAGRVSTTDAAVARALYDALASQRQEPRTCATCRQLDPFMHPDGR